jgi:uncharacterized damage-inducible protein DinB
MLLDNFRLMSRYNAWANVRLYEVCAGLPDGEYFKTRPAFFKSIHRTLNHILLADRIWLSRIKREMPITLPLDTELYTTLDALRAARVAEDEGIIGYVGGLRDADLPQDVHYSNTRGDPFRTPLGVILQHFFNHQSHHRGQVHDMLTQTTVAPPVLDLIYFVRD